jgi:tryptophan halogenase
VAKGGLMNFFIVGGGTAGWITALHLKKTYPSSKVELIESEEIGVLGAGESTTMPFFNELNYLEIDHKEFIRETKSTFKSIVRFDGWHKDNDYFGSPMYPWIPNITPELYGGNLTEYFTYCLASGIDIKSKGYSKIALSNKAPYALIDNNLVQLGSFTYQINAKLTAAYFRKIALSRGIIRHEGKITKINGKNPIESIEDNKGNTHKFDFVFDCSGFARLIIGKHYETRWIDYTKHLTVDSAIPFFLPMDKEIPPYSQATAMNHGWMFKVPTQERYGSGYVFDSNRINAEEAKIEVENKLGYEVTLVNNFKFKAGVYEKNWISNCISLGLSSGFLEPMSATNIGTMLNQLNLLNDKINNHTDKDINEFNVFSKKMSEEFMSLVFSHYLNPIRKTDFWNHYADEENYPTLLRKTMNDNFSLGKFDIEKFSQDISQNPNKMLTVFAANGMYRRQAQDFCDKYYLNSKYRKIDMLIESETNRLLNYAIDHRVFLENYC